MFLFILSSNFKTKFIQFLLIQTKWNTKSFSYFWSVCWLVSAIKPLSILITLWHHDITKPLMQINWRKDNCNFKKEWSKFNSKWPTSIPTYPNSRATIHTKSWSFSKVWPMKETLSTTSNPPLTSLSHWNHALSPTLPNNKSSNSTSKSNSQMTHLLIWKPRLSNVPNKQRTSVQ